MTEELNVPYETLRKAIQQGRIREPRPADQTSPSPPASPAAATAAATAATDKSTRSDADAPDEVLDRGGHQQFLAGKLRREGVPFQSPSGLVIVARVQAASTGAPVFPGAPGEIPVDIQKNCQKATSRSK